MLQSLSVRAEEAGREPRKAVIFREKLGRKHTYTKMVSRWWRGDASAAGSLFLSLSDTFSLMRF